jgi:hypothetical protein
LTAPWGEGPRIFDLENLDSARAYCCWLGSRYARFNHLVWVLGGDRPARLAGDEALFPVKNGVDAGFPSDMDWTPIWRAMASGLKESGAKQLIAYHPQGGTQSSSVFLHEESWLDLNAIQSGHGGGHDVPVWESVSRDYQLTPPKPTFDAEPNYEDSPVSPWPVWDPATGFFDDFDVRKQIYRSIFAGGCGAVYGNHCVWQFASDRYEPVLEVRFDWKQALIQPGAEGILHLRALLESVDFLEMYPQQSRLLSEHGARGSHARAMGSDSVSLIYVPDGRTIEVDLGWAQGKSVLVGEFDPRNGQFFFTDQLVEGGGSTTCEPHRPGLDRVVIVKLAP